jgi:hypothetical protein
VLVLLEYFLDGNHLLEYFLDGNHLLEYFLDGNHFHHSSRGRRGNGQGLELGRTLSRDNG